MNQLLQDLLEQLKSSSLAAKATAILVALALVAVAVVAGVAGGEPHFEMLYSGLDDNESAAIQRALAEGGMDFEVSQPPGPFVIYVPRDARYTAQNLVAASGALEFSPRGIPGSESGLSTVFMSSSEREQMVRKREWEETEGMLEEMDFVIKARVRTSARNSSPFGAKDPTSASVTLQLRHGDGLSREQADSVASLVRFALGVEREHLVIADQNGNNVFDGSDTAEERVAEDWITFLEEHDRGLEARVNSALLDTFGDSRARVLLRSQWDFDEVHTRSERTENTKAIVSENKSTTKTPQGASSPVGGPAGTASNVSSGAFGVDQAGVAQASASKGSGEPLIAETLDNKTEYVPSWTSTESRRIAPRLERLSVSLFLARELSDEQALLEGVVKAAVGFDETRGDVLQSMSIDFPKTAVEGEPTGEPSEGAPAEATEVVLEEEGSPIVDMLLSTGVEMVAALAFVILLFKSIRGSKSEGEPEADAEGGAGDEVDTEALARARVDEMLIQDPERVGEILSTWAKDETARSA